MKKRVISLMLSIVILVSMIPVSARAENHPTSGKCGENATWTFDKSTGVLTISGYGPMFHYSRERYVDGGAEILEDNPPPWHVYNWDICSIVIDTGITSIGNDAFSCCFDLTEVFIPNSVTNIGDYAFNCCHYLTRIALPDSVTNIGRGAFEGCGFTDITIPDSITRIAEGAFQACVNLTKFTIPYGVQCVSRYAFYHCDSLTEITIPNSVTTIEEFAFQYCDGLTEITIPDSVTTIGEAAFQYCESLTEITIPNSVTTIGDAAFMDCDSLTEITIPDSVTTIEASAFKDCDGLTEITIPDSVTAIEASTFYDCDSLTEITIPDSVTTIGDHAFFDCNRLTEITIPDSVTAIGEAAFQNCDSLTEITIPDSVTTIEKYAFWPCDNLTDVYYRGTEQEWGNIAIHTGNSDLMRATIHYNWSADAPGDKPQQPDPEPEIDTHNSIAELTELDYLAFSSLAYNKDLDSQSPYANIRQIYGDAWNTKWAEHTTESILVSELYGAIANWEIFETFPLSVDFYAVAFRNPVSGNVVIAYRGSENPVKMFEGNEDAIGDWVLNDLPMLFTGQLGTQFPEAQEAYETVAKEVSASGIAVTGHSLGGAWADAISALYGCKGVSVNAVPVLDVVYDKKPELYGDTFTGIENWNFIDHANQHDYLAGVNEVLFSSVPMKPYVAHKDVSGAWDPVTPHSIWTLITRNNDGALGISEIVPSKGVQAPVIQERDWSYVNLGSVSTDILSTGLGIFKRQTSYGGNGMDEINTGIWEDILVGGSGGDRLDGSYGDDVYYYFKGDGHDYIYDIGGKDTIRLFGFDSSDSILVAANPDEKTVEIHCNGETILSVFTKNRVESVILPDMFQIQIMNGNSIREQHDITGFFSTKKYGSHMLVACPVDIEILDASGNVVFMLNDGEVGNHYTDYGNFYIFEEADGGYGKVLDLVDGYTARIRGAGTGEMDITHQIPVNGVLSEATYVSSVPVTESMIATVETDDSGKTVLVVDADGDGKTDSKLKFVSEGGEPEVLLGDVNGDGKINPKDAAMVLQHFVDKPITGFDADAADVNNDGKINPKDAAMILQRFVDKLDENFKPRG